MARFILFLVLSVLYPATLWCTPPSMPIEKDSIMQVLSSVDSIEQMRILQEIAINAEGDELMLDKLASYYSNLNNFGQAIHFFREELQIVLRKGDSAGMGRATSGIALNYDLWEKYDSALMYYYVALKLAEDNQDKHLKAKTLNRLGSVYLNWGSYQKALDYYIRSMDIFEELQDSSGLSMASNNIGIILSDWGEYQNSLYYYEKSYLIDSLLNNRIGLAPTLNNIAVVYDEINEEEKARNAYHRSLTIATEEQDHYQMAISSANLGAFYIEMGELDKAEQLFIDAKDEYKQANSFIGIAEADVLLGDLYYEKGEYREAIKYYDNSLEIIKPLNLTTNLLNIYAGLDASYYELGNYDKAYDFNNEYWYLSDSIFNIKTSNQLALLQQAYALEKKDQEMELQKVHLEEQRSRINRQRILVIMLFVVVGIILSFIILLYRQYQLRIRAWKQLLTQHKEIIENRKAIILAKEKAEESDRLKTSFLMNLSHELRTPMNGIIGFTELLQKGNTSANEQYEYLSYISSSGQQLLKILNDIIDIASIETAQLGISNDHFNLHDVLGELFQYFDKDRQGQGKENVELMYQPPEDAETIVVFSDRKRLAQIIFNLLENAFKFTEQGSIVLSFEISSQNKLKIKVQDTGIGIERSMTDMIFDRFRQIDESPSRQHGGSGLGLAICKELAVLMHGKIKVESELGKGSLFILELPLQE